METRTQKSVKEKTRWLVETLPENCTWDDLVQKIYVCKSINAGLKDVEEGRTVEDAQVRKKHELEE